MTEKDVNKKGKEVEETKPETEVKKPDNQLEVKDIKKVKSDYVGRLEGEECVNNATGAVVKFRGLPTSVYTHLFGLACQETGFLNSGDFTRLCAQYGIYEFQNMFDENDDPVEVIRETEKIIGASTVYYVRSDIIDNLWIGLVNTVGSRVIELSRMTDDLLKKADFTIR